MSRQLLYRCSRRRYMSYFPSWLGCGGSFVGWSWQGQFRWSFYHIITVHVIDDFQRTHSRHEAKLCYADDVTFFHSSLEVSTADLCEVPENAFHIELVLCLEILFFVRFRNASFVGLPRGVHCLREKRRNGWVLYDDGGQEVGRR